MEKIKIISDEKLESVSGGFGKTKCGYNYNDNGIVDFKGLKIKADDWKWLLSHYVGDIEEKEKSVSTLSVHDVDKILDEHHRGLR